MKTVISILMILIGFQVSAQVPGIVVCKDSVLVHNKTNTDTNLYIQYLNQEIDQRWKIQVLESKLQGVYNYSKSLDTLTDNYIQNLRLQNILTKQNLYNCERSLDTFANELTRSTAKLNLEIMKSRKLKNNRNLWMTISGTLLLIITTNFLIK